MEGRGGNTSLPKIGAFLEIFTNSVVAQGAT